MSDICLLVEQSYPYYRTANSEWVNSLIQEMSDYSFNIVFMGGHRPQFKKIQYQLPSNVIDFQEYYLFDFQLKKQVRNRITQETFDLLEAFLVGIKDRDIQLFKDIVMMIRGDYARFDLNDLAYSYESWQLVQSLYKRTAEKESFLDFFWAWRFIYIPFFSILKINLPQSKLFHATTSSFSGVLGVLAKWQHQRPLFLTENELPSTDQKNAFYHSESPRYLSGADSYTTNQYFYQLQNELEFFFQALVYEEAKEVIASSYTLHLSQIEKGAVREKAKIINEGIRIEAGSGEEVSGSKKGILVIPDSVLQVKTVLEYAHQKQGEEKPEIFLYQSFDETSCEFEEFKKIIGEESVHHMSLIQTGAELPWEQLSVIVIGSQNKHFSHFVLLAMSKGLPVITGFSPIAKELLMGFEGDDQLLGSAGVMIDLNNQAKILEAIEKITTDAECYEGFAQTGRQRICTYYDLEQMILEYKMMYDIALEEIVWQD